MLISCFAVIISSAQIRMRCFRLHRNANKQSKLIVLTGLDELRVNQIKTITTEQKLAEAIIHSATHNKMSKLEEYAMRRDSMRIGHMHDKSLDYFIVYHGIELRWSPLLNYGNFAI